MVAIHILQSYHTLDLYQLKQLKYIPFKTVTSHLLKEVVNISKNKKNMMMTRGPSPSKKLKLFINFIGLHIIHDILWHIPNNDPTNIMDGTILSIERLDDWILSLIKYLQIDETRGEEHRVIMCLYRPQHFQKLQTRVKGAYGSIWLCGKKRSSYIHYFYRQMVLKK